MTYRPKYQILPIISGCLTILAFSHVFNKTRLTRETDHISYTWILLVLSAQTLLTIYGIINGAYGIYLPALIIINEVLYILYIKLSNEKEYEIEKDLIDKQIL